MKKRALIILPALAIGIAALIFLPSGPLRVPPNQQVEADSTADRPEEVTAPPAITHSDATAVPMQPAPNIPLVAQQSDDAPIDQSLWQAFRDARLRVDVISESQAAQPQNEDALFFANQPGQQFTARFLKDGGVRLGSGRPESPWNTTMRLQDAAPARPQFSRDARIEIPHSAHLTEWYENKPEGLEHGFVVHSPTADMHPKEGLQVLMNIEGMNASADPDQPGSLVLSNKDQTARLGYQKLVVTDAQGNIVPAEMEATLDGLAINLSVQHHAFPITIDPLIVNLEATLSPTTDTTDSAGDNLGFDVALDGDYAAIGAPEDDYAAPLGGAVYLFKQTGATWSFLRRLVADVADTNADFGRSITMDNDCMAVGAPLARRNGATTPGAVYIYERLFGDVWTFKQKLTADDGFEEYKFGDKLDIDNHTLIVGSSSHNEFIGAAYVFTRGASAWSFQQKLEAADGSAGDQFGGAVSIYGDTAFSSARYDDVETYPNAGSVYIFNRVAGNWTQTQKINLASEFDLGNYDDFGNAIDCDNQTLVVAAWSYNSPQLNNSGAAFVYVLSGNTWTLQQKLTASDSEESDLFGMDVAIEDDLLVIGARDKDTGPIHNSGGVYVFSRSGTTWSEIQEISHPTPGNTDYFGQGIAIDYPNILIGAHRDDTQHGVNAGSAHLFKDNGGWEFSQSFFQDITTLDNSGTSVSVDGDSLVVGSSDDDTASGVNSGSAYFFHRTDEAWTLANKVTSFLSNSNQHFGTAVSLSGNTAAISAPKATASGNTEAGMVHVFNRSGSNWSEHSTLIASDSAPLDQFGNALALDGDSLLIGAYFADATNRVDAGAAYVFSRSGNSWSFQQKLESNGPVASSRFGSSVDIHGETAVVSAPLSADGNGRAFVFTRSGTTWTPQQTLMADDGLPADFFGYTVTLDDNTIVVGAPLVDTLAGIDAGSAYVFTRSTSTWTQQQKIQQNNGVAGERLGSALDLQEGTLLIGAPYFDRISDGLDQVGRVFAYTGSGNSWVQETEITAPGGNDFAQFGFAISLSGNNAAIAGVGFDLPQANQSGQVHMYRIFLSQILLDVTEFIENPAFGAFISNINLGGATNGYVFTLIPGAGDTDNNLFAIIGTELKANGILDYEQQTNRTIRIQVDGGGQQSAKSFELRLIDDRNEDADQDGLTEAEEEDIYGTSDANFDDDGDQIPGSTEVLAGLDPAVNNSALTALIPTHLTEFGLDVGSLAIGQVIVAPGPFPASAQVTLDIQRSTNQVDFQKMDFQTSQFSLDPDGNVRISIDPADGPKLHRLQERQP